LRRSHEELELRVRQRTAELSAANTQLQAALAERRRLEHELLEITDKERRRIGLNLHDDLGQKLTGVALMVKSLEVRLTRQGIQGADEATRIHTLIKETMTQTRELSHDLMTLDLQEMDFASAIEGLVSHVERTFDIACRFHCEIDAPTLNPDAVSQMYKITQEAITNAVRHAKAKNVEIRLAKNGSDLLFSIRNDGTRFPAVLSAHAGLGLRIMSYRAHLIGAALEVKPGEREGAVLTCTLPLS
jgi:signal transduction histidine kinase